MQQINQINTEATTLNDDSFLPVDSEVSAVYTTKKVKWSTLKTLIGAYLLPLNNIWTGTNRFNKQVKIVSDGTNSPLVVRNSIDTTSIIEGSIGGQLYVRGSGGDASLVVSSPSGSYYPSIQLNANGAGFNAGVIIKAYDTSRLLISGQGNLNVRMYNDTMTINDDPSLNTKACFVVTSTAKGILIPRLTTTQRNAMGSTLPTSLLIFHIDANQFEYWNGTAWVGLISNQSNKFIPPKFTGANAEAITPKEEGMMVYATDGSGTTITAKGWWGWDGSTWIQF